MGLGKGGEIKEEGDLHGKTEGEGKRE